SLKAWSKYVSPISLENEIKRIRLRYDASLTTPGAFKGGGFQSARLDLSVLATLFAVVAKYDGDVRWQSEAAKARDLLSRTARNCATGSTQTFNEARLRKADLQDLVSGAALTVNQEPESDNDWSMITERSPMMEYVEQVLDDLSDHSRDLATTKSNVDAIRQGSEIIALMGEVLAQDGMDDSDDEDYVSLSRAMTKAASRVVAAIQRDDFESVRAAVGGISQTCADCHEQYR
ncbi:MAG: cytochrome c, partial [Planctomycetota bacterium]